MQIKYYNVSKTQLSIARFFGGMQINGKEYVYNPVDDTLTLKSELKKADKKQIGKATKKMYDDIKQQKIVF